MGITGRCFVVVDSVLCDERMAVIDGDLWGLNMAKVVVLDVTDDYRFMHPPLPSACYPVLAEVWVPRYRIGAGLQDVRLVDGYLYDWHESPPMDEGVWYVGVVDEILVGGDLVGGV